MKSILLIDLAATAFFAAGSAMAEWPAVAAGPGAAPEQAKPSDAATSAFVAQAAPAVQDGARASIGAATDAALAVAHAAADWSCAPRRTFQARRL